ncbi:uncharacterized protein N7496_010230 [Penicillium cataractarum]|uniref:Uncharacterized protein n=1 Tax=Penicillium cataractarum TaxID=2100454 RepID=A0A9W9RQN7_9EURO|nr:uncharacterized protein N7496_010230 [Penicillium cataractarum]KAJ5364517.1 hypothetical protein N7496_010230 [Penicillium cataractarum]
MLIPVNIFQDGEDSALEFAPNPWVMKRAHELDPDDDGDTPRKGWKRLTTKEEVTLFEICNRHADSFGRRSDLCNWWKTVATEFSHANGRPYSWHSVRRKVEMVTKKRIKFLEDQQQRQRDYSGANPVPDVMNPQWCAVLDLWIPTWQHWEESEAQRIAKRDATYRKRSQSKLDNLWKPPPQAADPALEPVDLTSPASPDDTGIDANDSYEGPIVLVTRSPQPTTVPATAAPTVDRPSSIPASNGGVRLPPGFDTMFANNHSQPTRWPPTFAPAPRAAEPSSDNRVFSAMLEAIGKLNRHLDAASDNNRNNDAPDARASPVISALVQSATESTPQNPASSEDSRRASSSIPSRDFERIKEELRREMREEMRRERVAFEEKLDSVQRTQDMILEMLRQEPA